MKESCVGAFARNARRVALAAVVLLVSATALSAQATGKLEGRIRDQAGAPIAGAQVRIEGTAYGAVADARGYYFINNIPAGTVDLLAQFVGYKPVRTTGLVILAGQTITQDFSLEQQPVELGEIEVQAAQNVLVPRDATATKQAISGEFTSKLPVDRLQNVIVLQPGVVQTTGGNVSVRGGRTDETVYYIDGVPVSPGGRGGEFVGTNVNSRGVDVSTESFEQASVTTGSATAEFGNAQSGIVQIATKAGGSKWAGSVGYTNDAIGGLNHSTGYTRVQASVGGPIIERLTVNVSGDLEGNKSAAFGLDNQNYPVFVPAGIDTTVSVVSASSPADTSRVDVLKFAEYTGNCDEFSSSVNKGIASNYGYSCKGAQIPYSANGSYRASGKLQYTYGTGNRIAFTALRSLSQARNFGLGPNFQPVGYGFIAAPENFTGSMFADNALILSWSQSLSKSVDRALNLSVYGSYQWDRAETGPLTTQGELDTRDPFGGFLIKPFDFLYNFNNFNITNIDQNFRTNTGVLTPVDIHNTQQYQQVAQWRTNPYGVLGGQFLGTNGNSFIEAGGPTGRLSMYKEDRALGKADLDWQVDRYNRVTLGGEYTKYYMNSYSSGITSQAFSDAYHEKPQRYDAYIQDKLDLGDVVLIGGLRYDWFKTGASRPYYFADTLGNLGWFPRVSTMPGFNPANPAASAAGCTVGGPVAASCVNQYAGLIADQSHNYLSPHISVAFPVSERTNFRLSYAHQVQQPDFQLILGGINTDLTVTNSNHVYGSDLGYGRTITFEFGVTHSFNEDMVLDVAAYNKDILSDAAGRLLSYFDPKNLTSTSIRVITNLDYGNTRGIDVRFDRRIGELFNGRLAYTFQQSKNTGSDPFTYINFGSRVLNAIAGGNSPPPQAIQTTNQDRPHNLSAQLELAFPNHWKQGTAAGSILQNVGVTATARFASGTPYTACGGSLPADVQVISGGVCSQLLEGTFQYNGQRLPMYKQFDLRVTKGFNLGRFDLTAFADIRNLFNFKDEYQVFSQTGDVTNPQAIAINRLGDLQAFAQEASANGVLGADSTINLTFGGTGTGGCGNWVNQGGASATPNCIYLIRAEQRYGNGDGLFTVAEQTRASDALYNVFRGLSSFTLMGRQIRLGLEVNF